MWKYLCSNIKHLWLHPQELTSRHVSSLWDTSRLFFFWGGGFTSLHYQQQSIRSPLSRYPFHNLLSFSFPIMAILKRVLWNLNIDLICISMMAKDSEHFKNFTYPLVFLLLWTFCPMSSHDPFLNLVLAKYITHQLQLCYPYIPECGAIYWCVVYLPMQSAYLKEDCSLSGRETIKCQQISASMKGLMISPHLHAEMFIDLELFR